MVFSESKLLRVVAFAEVRSPLRERKTIHWVSRLSKAIRGNLRGAKLFLCHAESSDGVLLRHIV